ncbi:MAG: DUF4252 domain-containing protein [Bacteroidota bacterium]
MRLIVVLMMSLPLFLSAQSTSIQKFFDAHKGNEDYTLIEITGNLFNLTKKNKNKKSKVRIDGFQLLSAPKGNAGISMSEVKSFANSIKREQFEDLIVIRDSDTRFNFMVQEDDGIINELVMIADEEDSITIMSLQGWIPTEELEKLHEEVDIEGLEKLDKN